MSSSTNKRDITVIVAAAGPTPQPSWTLHLPDGRPALASVVESLNCKNVSRFIFVCLKQHVLDFCPNHQLLSESLQKVNPELKGRVELLMLDEPTKSGVETIVKTIKEAKIEGGIFIKDADGAFEFEIPSNAQAGSYCVGLKITDSNVNTLSEITRKSFIQQCGGILTNIVEKKLISDIIAVGGYAFESAQDYVSHAEKLEKEIPSSFYDAAPPQRKQGVLFNSDIILSLLADQHVVSVKFVDTFHDWKSQTGVQKFCQSHENVIVSLESDLCERRKEHGFNAIELKTRTENNEETLNLLKQLFRVKQEVVHELSQKVKFASDRCKIVITTSLPKSIENSLEVFLKESGVPFNVILCDMFSGAKKL